MLVRFIALILSLALSISVVAEMALAEDMPYFREQRLDPNFSTPRTVMLTKPSYLYSCVDMYHINSILRDRGTYGYFQGYRTNLYGGVKCDYLTTGGTEAEYILIPGLDNLVPLINPGSAPRTPLPANLNRKYNEVLVPYRGALTNGTPFHILLSHQVINSQVQTGVGYDFLSFRFGK